jgi:hypothetical protein
VSTDGLSSTGPTRLAVSKLGVGGEALYGWHGNMLVSESEKISAQCTGRL